MISPLDILHPWQRRYFFDFCRESRLITLASRQIGKSFMGAFCCVYDAIINGANWTLVSTGQRAADRLFKECVRVAKYLQGMLKGTRLHFSFYNTASQITFSNGATIVSVPNNPDGLRGASSSVLFDEMAFIENASDCWQACIPFLTSPHGGTKKLQILSTPAASSGKFFELWEKSDFYKTKITLFDAVSQGLKVDIDEIRKTCFDDDVFRQEYMCEFLDGDSLLFPYTLLRDSIAQAPINASKTYLGIDIGREHDLTAIAFLVEANGILYIDRIDTIHNVEFAEQESIISGIIRNTNPVKVSIDATGIGAMLAENLHRQFKQVEEVKFTAEIKQTIFNQTKARMSDGTLKLPPMRDDICNDFAKIRRVVSPSGNLTYSASRDESGHADKATAIALAVYAARKPKGQIFMPVG